MQKRVNILDFGIATRVFTKVTCKTLLPYSQGRALQRLFCITPYFDFDLIPYSKSPEVRRRFEHFDVDGSNAIDYGEFSEMMAKLLRVKDPSDISEHRIKRWFKEADPDGSGEVSFEAKLSLASSNTVYSMHNSADLSNFSRVILIKINIVV